MASLKNGDEIIYPEFLIKSSVLLTSFEAIKQQSITQDEIDNLLKLQQLAHYKMMRTLDVITSVAPLLGILGTIWGIIGSFNLAGELADIEPAAAMSGMAEAFITAAFGLMVSLFSLFAYHYFQSLSEKDLVASDVYLTSIKVELEKRE